MLPLLLIPFIPKIKDAVVSYILPSISGEGVDKKDIKKLSKKLYTKIPSYIRIVDEESFVEFCMKYQDAIFPQKKVSAAKAKKSAKKIAPKKKAAKKAAVKKASRRKKQS